MFVFSLFIEVCHVRLCNASTAVFTVFALRKLGLFALDLQFYLFWLGPAPAPVLFTP